MKCVFLYNPNSGRKKIAKNLDFIVSELKAKYDEVFVYATKAGNDAYHYLKQNAKDIDVLVVSGGDGTLNECVSAICDSNQNLPIIYLPSGTVNDVARTLKIPLDAKKALKIVDSGQKNSYDILQVGDSYGLYVCCFGIFTETSYATPQKLKNIFGKIAYALYFLKILFKQKAQKLNIEVDQKKYEGYFSCLFAVNSKSLSGFKINKNADMNDGKVDCFLIRTKSSKIRLTDIFRLFKVYIQGIEKVKENKYIKKFNTSQIKVVAPKQISVNLDGEQKLMQNFEINVLKDKIQFFQEREK